MMEEIFLKEKIQYEYESFVLSLKMEDKDTIIAKSQEIQVKKRIVLILKNISLFPLDLNEIGILSAQENLLEKIYGYLLKTGNVEGTAEGIWQGVLFLLGKRDGRKIYQEIYGITAEPGMTEDLDYADEEEVVL